MATKPLLDEHPVETRVVIGLRAAPLVFHDDISVSTIAAVARARRHRDRVSPGILGSKLADSVSGVSVWGAFPYGASDADTPEGARLIALPMRMGEPLSVLVNEEYATEAVVVPGES